MTRSGNRTTLSVLVAFALAAVACSSSSSTSQATVTTPSPSNAESGLYAVDISTGEMSLFLEPLEEGPVFATTELVLSPDTSLIAFEDTEADRHQISVMNADGTELHQLTHEGAAGTPAWSADGARIAFRNLAPDSTYEIYVVDVASGESNRITKEPLDVEGTPSWSPDGTTLVYQVGEHPMIRSIDLATGEAATILKDAGIPDISPDGNRLAFNTWSVAKVTLADMDGSDRTMIHSDSDECCAKWSPNGERIALIDYLTGQVFVYEVATGEKSVAGSGDLVDWLDDQTLLVRV
jgi:Tol biopolymer transport system component